MNENRVDIPPEPVKVESLGNRHLTLLHSARPSAAKEVRKQLLTTLGAATWPAKRLLGQHGILFHLSPLRMLLSDFFGLHLHHLVSNGNAAVYCTSSEGKHFFKCQMPSLSRLAECIPSAGETLRAAVVLKLPLYISFGNSTSHCCCEVVTHLACNSSNFSFNIRW